VNKPSLLFALSFALVVALSPMATDIYLPAIPDIARSLGADIQVIEISISTYFLGVAAGQLIAAPVSDRLGRRPVVIAGVVVFLAGAAGMIFVDSAEQLLALRLLQGLGAGAGAVNVLAAVGDLYDEHDAARMLATIHIIVLTAPLVAPIIGAILVSSMPWQSIFVFLTFYALLVVAGTLRVMPETLQPSHRPTAPGSIVREIVRDYRHVLSRPRALQFNLAISLAFSCFFIFLTDAAFIYLDYFGLPTLSFPLLFGANIVIMMLGNRVNVWLLARHRPRQIIPWGHGLQVTAAAALVVCTSLPSISLYVLVPLIMLATAANTLIVSNSTARYISLFSSRRGTASAVSGVMQFLAVGVISIFVGIVHDGTPRTMAAAMLVCAAAAAVFTTLILRAERVERSVAK
jgi:DHA1 family bicyclomycin/chloramphenicol resistance-like MFS transporter